MSRVGERGRLFALGIVLLSRAYSIALIVTAGGVSEAGWIHLTDAGSAFAAWDGQWYIHIAEHGYHREPLVALERGGYHDFAFFPLWPALIRIVSFGVIPAELAATVAANVLFVIAALLAFEVFRRLSPETTALRGLALFCFAPAAFVGSMAYSESLFLALAAAYFLVSPASPIRPALAALALAARLTGLALAAASAVVITRRPVPSVLAIAAIAVVSIGWVAFVALLTGDPTGYLRGSPSWYTVGGSVGGLLSLIDGIRHPSPYLLIAVPLTVVMLLGSVGLWRQHPELAAYSFATAAMTIAVAHWVNWPRHSWLAFPAFLWLAQWLPARAHAPVLGLFCAGQAVLVVGTIRWASFPP